MPLRHFKKIIFSITIFSAIFSLASFASAAVTKIDKTQCGTWGIYCTGGDDEAFEIANYIWYGIQVVSSFLAVLAAAALTYYGILYIISRGEEDKARQAKTGIAYAVLGLLVAGLAAILVNAIINI